MKVGDVGFSQPEIAIRLDDVFDALEASCFVLDGQPALLIAAILLQLVAAMCFSSRQISEDQSWAPQLLDFADHQSPEFGVDLTAATNLLMIFVSSPA